MSLVTLRVIDGADRGRTFHEIPTPFTVGREEGNGIQVNDERVSRFHLKIQENDDKIVLTDLQSTNGTRVNGENVQLWILRPGDVISIGRSVLLFGSREQIAERLAVLRGVDLASGVSLVGEDLEGDTRSVSLDFDLNWPDDPDARPLLHTLVPPQLPRHLEPSQAAQLTELLLYLHLRVRGLIQSVKSRPKNERVTLEQRQWQNLLDLQERLALYLRDIGEPQE